MHDFRPEVVFSTNNSSITRFRVNEDQTSKHCFVLFSALGLFDLRSKVGGTDALLEAGFDVFSVQTNNNDFHQSLYPEGIVILDEIIKKDYDLAYGYGSSMGAFAAILYASKLNLARVLAFNPPFTIGEAFDQRWLEYDRKVEWRYKMMEARDYGGILVIYYDPCGLDAKQFALFEKHFKSAEIVAHPVRYSSHMILFYFRDAGRLKSMLLDFAKGNYREQPKVDRRTNITYLRELSLHLMRRNKLVAAKSIIKRVLAFGDQSNMTYRRASNICAKLNDIEEALTYAQMAVDAQDNTNESRRRHQEHLAGMKNLNGDGEGARRIIDGLIASSSHRASAYRAKAGICLTSGLLEEAKEAILAVIELGDESHSTFALARNVFFRLGNLDEAVVYAQKAIFAEDNSETSQKNHMQQYDLLVKKQKRARSNSPSEMQHENG
nr:tetratricopeptide repeat protein [uncultured Cohaesibacter sp.]